MANFFFTAAGEKELTCCSKQEICQHRPKMMCFIAISKVLFSQNPQISSVKCSLSKILR